MSVKFLKCDTVSCLLLNLIMITQSIEYHSAMRIRGGYSYWHPCHAIYYSRKYLLA
jgi:hypothetical protein